MNHQRKQAIVIAAFMIAFFWGFVTEVIVFAAGKIATPHGWITILVMAITFFASLFGLSVVTSETRISISESAPGQPPG